MAMAFQYQRRKKCFEKHSRLWWKKEQMAAINTGQDFRETVYLLIHLPLAFEQSMIITEDKVKYMF